METKINGGVVFKNTNKKAETHPDYKGTINVDGVDKEIALWIKQSSKGTSYFSASISNPYVKQETQSAPMPPIVNDDLPF